jgi:hypothetical protein
MRQVHRFFANSVRVTHVLEMSWHWYSEPEGGDTLGLPVSRLEILD